MSQQPRQRFPSWKQALLILAAGIVLALSSCGLFLGNLESNDKLEIVFTVGFFLGVGITIFGAILVLIRAIRGPGARAPEPKSDKQSN
jgi:hypothetical protein